MAGWHSKELGDGVEAFAPTTRIQESFLTLAQTQARTGHYPFDAAVFSRYDLVSVRGLYESDESVIRRPLLKS